MPRDDRFHKCPRCDRWWIIPDRDPPEIPPAPLGYHLPALREVSRKCAAGFERSDAVIGPSMRCLAELQKLQTQAITRPQRHLIWRCIRALEKIH
ncbi:MAG: hypothetical protein ACYCW6_28645, partial [Candidatus Xenobia bacterium]